MRKRKIHRNDEVIVLTGKNKGKRGIVERYVDDDYVVVSGVNVARKAVKPNPSSGVVGGIVEKFLPVHISNVALFNSATGKASKVGFKLVDGAKVRVFKSTGEVIGG